MNFKIKKSLPALLITFFLSTGYVFGQDVIHLSTGETIEAKISEVGVTEVAFKKHSNPTGPIYRIEKKKISKIVYQNGEEDVFGKITRNQEGIKDNAISFNYAALITNRIELSYQRFFKEDKFGLKIPIGIGYQNYQGNSYGYWLGYPRYTSGIDLNYYPMGQRKVTYYTGISMKIALHKWTAHYYSGAYPYQSIYQNEEAFTFGAYVTNGISVHWTDRFAIGGQIGLGIRDQEGFHVAEPHVVGELNATIRF